MNTTQLIYRVLSGEASQEEKHHLEQWKALNDANRSEYEDIKMLWECSRDTEDLSEEGYRHGWQQIKQRILVLQKKRQRMRVIILALIIVLVLAVIGWIAYSRGQQEKPSLHTRIASLPSRA